MIKIIYIYVLLLIFNCASQSLPQGGPKDVSAPLFLKVVPVNNSDIKNYDKIIIEFNERINPNSIIGSIKIDPLIDVFTKVKGNKIVIEPLIEWPKTESVQISLSRNISDFQSNKIKQQIHLIYNNRDNEYCSINGQLFNASKKFHNIYIYDFPVNNFDKPIKKIESDEDNSFMVNYLDYGKYILISSEGNLDIHNNRYGMVPYEYIDLNKSNCNPNISLYMDEPLEKMKITRVETITTNLLNISYDNNIIEPYFLDKVVNDGDSIYIGISKDNRLQRYELPTYLYLGKSKLDTIPPSINSINTSDTLTIVGFSEPIKMDSLIVLGVKNNSSDDDLINIEYEVYNPMSVQFLNSNLKEIKFLGASIQDLSQNKMLDSIKVHVIEDKIIDQGTSVVRGKILNPIKQNIIVEAKNISLNLSYADIVKDSLFAFQGLYPGKYIFRAYEQKNKINPLVYFSGTLEPYENAAEFTIYKDTIEVRKFWDTKGINIEF